MYIVETLQGETGPRFAQKKGQFLCKCRWPVIETVLLENQPLVEYLTVRTPQSMWWCDYLIKVVRGVESSNAIISTLLRDQSFEQTVRDMSEYYHLIY